MTKLQTDTQALHDVFKRLEVDKHEVEKECLSNPRADYNQELTRHVLDLLQRFYEGEKRKLEKIKKANPIAVFSTKSSNRVSLIAKEQTIIVCPKLLFAKQKVPHWFQKEQKQGRYSGVKIPDDASDLIVASEDEFAAQLAFAVVPWLNREDLEQKSKIAHGLAYYQAVLLLDKLGLNPEYAIYAYAKSGATNTETIRYKDMVSGAVLDPSELRPGESLRTLRTALVECRYENRSKTPIPLSSDHPLIKAADKVPDTAFVANFLDRAKYARKDLNGKMRILTSLAQQGDLSIEARRADCTEALSTLISQPVQQSVELRKKDFEILSDQLLMAFVNDSSPSEARTESSIYLDASFRKVFGDFAQFCKNQFGSYLGILGTIETELSNFIDAVTSENLPAAEKAAEALAIPLKAVQYRESKRGFIILTRLEWPEFDIEVATLSPRDRFVEDRIESSLDHEDGIIGGIASERDQEYDPFGVEADPWEDLHREQTRGHAEPSWSDAGDDLPDFIREQPTEKEEEPVEPEELVPWQWLAIDSQQELSENFMEAAALTGAAIDPRLSLRTLNKASYRFKLHTSKDSALDFGISVLGTEVVRCNPLTSDPKREFLNSLFEEGFLRGIHGVEDTSDLSQTLKFAKGLDLTSPEELDDRLIEENPYLFFSINIPLILENPVWAQTFFEKLAKFKDDSEFYQDLEKTDSDVERQLSRRLADYFKRYKRLPSTTKELLSKTQLLKVIENCLIELKSEEVLEVTFMETVYRELERTDPEHIARLSKPEEFIAYFAAIGNMYPNVRENAIGNIQTLIVVPLSKTHPDGKLPTARILIDTMNLSEDAAQSVIELYRPVPVGKAISRYISARISRDDIQNPSLLKALRIFPRDCRSKYEQYNTFDSEKYVAWIKTIVEKASELPPPDRIDLMADLMSFSSAYDPNLRTSIQTVFCQAVLEEVGFDNEKDKKYAGKLKAKLESAFAKMNSLFRLAVSDQLAITLQAQLEVNELIHDLAEEDLRGRISGSEINEVDEEYENLAVFGGVVASFVLHVIRCYPETHRMLTDYLTSEGSPADRDRFHREIDDFVLDKETAREYCDTLTDFDLETLYNNFWGQAFEKQVLVARELYFPKETGDAAAWQAAFEPAMRKLTEGSPYQEKIVEIANEYITTIDFARCDLVVTAALLAGRNTTTTGDVGKSLAMFFAYSGIAETIFGQRLAPFLPKELSDGMEEIKYNAQAPNRLKQNRYLKVIERSLLSEFDNFLRTDCDYRGVEFTVQHLGARVGAASICFINGIQLSNGTQGFNGVLAMQRLGALSSGRRGFGELATTCDKLGSKKDFEDIVHLFSELLPIASDRLTTETNCTLARPQFAMGQQMFCNREAEINGQRFISDSVPVYACGEVVIGDDVYGYYLMPTAPGEVFGKWLKEQGGKQKSLTRDAIMFDLTINWIEYLRLMIEADRHAGNKFFDPKERRMTQIDMKAIAMTDWTQDLQAINQLAEILARAAGTQEGFKDIQHRVAVVKSEIRKRDGRIYPLVNEIHCALQAQADGIKALPEETRAKDIQTAFLSALRYSEADWPLVEALIQHTPSIARTHIKDFVTKKDLGRISAFTGIRNEDLIIVRDAPSTLFPAGEILLS